MDVNTLALTLAEEHNDVDCCPLHLAIFGEGVNLIGAGHGWAPVTVLN